MVEILGVTKLRKDYNMKKEALCMCKICGKSSNAGSKCLYESDKMAYCFTFIKIKERKSK